MNNLKNVTLSILLSYFATASLKRFLETCAAFNLMIDHRSRIDFIGTSGYVNEMSF